MKKILFFTFSDKINMQGGQIMFEIIAMLTMFIDHLGIVFFPEQIIFRIIGRMAFPLYAYALTQGYKYTSNFNNYCRRLFYLALISQVPYVLLFNTFQLNIIFTLLICLLLLKLFTQIKNKFYYIPFFLLTGSLEIFQCEYGLYAFLLVLIYYFNHNIVWRHNFLNIFFLFLRNWSTQLFSFLPSVLIKYCENRPLEGKTRNFYRLFYPLHLTLLFLITR